jgi:PAS domain S-box-containing protein
MGDGAEDTGRSDTPKMDEIIRLQRRIAELEQSLAERVDAEQTVRSESEERLNSILNSLDDIVWSQSPTTFDVFYLNPVAERIYGRRVRDFIADAELWLRVVHLEDLQRVLDFFPIVLETEGAEIEYRILRPDGEIRWLHDRAHAVRDAAGEIIRIDGIATDITEQKQAEAEREERQRQAEVIRVQEALLRELSTPLIPISEHIVVMPLIGSMDSRRAQQVLETLLNGIAANGAQVAIIDITGIPVVDTQVANALLQAAQAVKLLGAQVVLTGIRPEVAQTLIALDADWTALVTRSTLQSGIAFAMSQR